MKSTPVTPKQRKQLTAFMKARPWLIWYSTNYEGFDPEAIVEATLNRGDWDDVQTLFAILGMRTVANVFRAQTNRTRVNYYPIMVDFFTRYFKRHAPLRSYAR